MFQRRKNRAQERDLDVDDPRPKLDISATRVFAGMVAATASALLGSSIGLAGTVLGAAVGAAAYTIAAALYEHSVARTKRRLRRARAIRVRRLHGYAAADRADAVGEYAETAGEPFAVAADDTIADEGDASSPGTADEPVATTAATGVAPSTGTVVRPPRRERFGKSPWSSVLAGALGSAFAFGLALVLVTGINSAKSSPSSGDAGGPRVLGGIVAGQQDSDEEPPHPSWDVRTDVSTATRTAVRTKTAVVTSTRTAVTTPTTGTSAPGGSASSGPVSHDPTPGDSTAPGTAHSSGMTTPTAPDGAGSGSSGEGQSGSGSPGSPSTGSPSSTERSSGAGSQDADAHRPNGVLDSRVGGSGRPSSAGSQGGAQ